MSEENDTSQLRLGQRIRYLLEAGALFGVLGLFRICGLDGASTLGGFIGRNILRRIGQMNRARENLRNAYPGKSEAEIEAIVTEMSDNLGRTVAEFAHLDKLKLHGDNPRLEFVGTEHGDAAYARGKGVIFFSGHFANWETMPFAAAQFGYKGGEVYRPLNNPYVNRWVVAQRQKNGTPDQIAQGTARDTADLHGAEARRRCVPAGRSKDKRRPADPVLRPHCNDDASAGDAGAEARRDADPGIE